jgi:short-subunit dehydrogenase involved in D-alanine esterification of teichoic acids
MATSLRDASVVIIGGSSGIGLATAMQVRAAGAAVTIAGRDERKLAAAREAIGGDVLAAMV